MALRGNLRDFHTSQLLNLIHLARKTGTLTVESRNGTAQLCFKDGKLIHAVLDRQDGRLADVLIRAGKLRPEQLQALDLSRVQDDKVLGLKLIEAGYVTQQDILASLRAQMLDVVYRLFGWNEGAFRFEPHLQPVQNRIPVPVDLENVIMEGVRRLREVERLKEELPDLDIPVRLTSRPEAIRKVQLSPEEWRVISQVNGAEHDRADHASHEHGREPNPPHRLRASPSRADRARRPASNRVAARVTGLQAWRQRLALCCGEADQLLPQVMRSDP
jgi:hypothetical protein